MSILTGVPSNLHVPGTFHRFNYLRAAGSLVTFPMTVALIGTKTSAGTATAGTVYPVEDPAVTDALFGVRGELSLMCRMAYKCAQLFGRGPIVKAVAVAEPGGGVANVKTLTAVGTATTDSDFVFRVAGRTISVGIRSGTLQNAFATAINSELSRLASDLPVANSVATNVVTLTHPTKGINGTDIKVTIEQQVPGVVVTLANTAVGSGVADHQPGIDALSPLRYDGIALANHAAADVTQVLNDIATRWGLSSKTWGWYHIGEPGSQGTAAALSTAANHRAAIFHNIFNCPNTAGEIAVAGAMLQWSREKANAAYNGATVPLYPPPDGDIFTVPEQESSIAAGVTPYMAAKDAAGRVIQTRMKCVRMVTSQTTDSGGFPDERNRDVCVARVGVKIAMQFDAAVEDRLGPDDNPEGIGQEESKPLIKDLAADILRAEAEAKEIRSDFVEEDIAGILIEEDGSTDGRNNVRLPYHVNTPLHQIAVAHDITIGV